MSMSPTSLRTALPTEQRTLARLAALDSKAAPRGPVLVAEVEGDIPAALALDTGTVYANPFRRTAHLVELLELHARAA
jgi:hypothetical protein